MDGVASAPKSAPKGVDPDELDAAIAPLAIERRAEQAAPSAREIQAPLPGGWIVEAQSDEVEAAGCAVLMTSATLALPPQRGDDLDAVIGHPIVGVRKRMQEASGVDRPTSELRVEIVGAVARLREGG